MIEEGLWKIAAFLLCIVLLFVVPLYLSYERQEEVIYHTVLTEVDSFSEKVREVGYVDSSMIRQLEDSLSATGYFYKIEFEHLAKQFSDNEGKIEVFYEGTYTEDIYSVLSSGERYPCNIGDFFFVKVKNTTLSKTAALRQLLGIKYKGSAIRIKSGGIIRYGDT